LKLDSECGVPSGGGLIHNQAMNAKITATLCFFAGFAGLAAGVAAHYLIDPGPVRAQKFVLVDENGTPRGVFGLDSDGTPTVQVRFGHPFRAGEAC
jgi:hypothetical protein